MNRRPALSIGAMAIAAAAPMIGAMMSCGGPPSRVEAPATVHGSSSASPAPLMAKAGEATPIALRTTAGACAVELNDSPGSAYRFDPAQQRAVEAALTQAMQRCYAAPKGAHGTLHLTGKVDPAGKVSEVVIAPGGALSTEVAACTAKALTATPLAPPLDSPAELLLFIVSRCPRR